jgi:glutamate carboxypeptidase
VTGEDIASAVARLRRYVEHETPSGDEVRCAALADVIAQDLRQLGASVSTVPAAGMGKHVLADFPHSEPTGHLLILGHLDTVHPVGTLTTQPFTITDDQITGPGVYDMKAGVALMIEALARLRHEQTPTSHRIRMLVTCDEEVGSHTSLRVIEEQAQGAVAVLVPEPSLPGGGVKSARKGVATYRLNVHGRAAHAGVEPERGINAITELAHQILAVQELGNAQLGTTVSVGTVSGGTASNVVPARATATIDVRYAQNDEGARVRRALDALTARHPGAAIELGVIDSRPPLERNERIIALYHNARAIAAELGFELGEGGTGGGSDGCLTAALGVPTLDGLGPQGGGAHAVDEHVRRQDLSFRLAFYMALLEKL